MATMTDLPTIYRGEDIVIRATYSPVTDITGFTHEFNLARDQNITAKLLTVACATLLAGEGSLTITITSAQLEAIEPGLYFFDVWRTDSGNRRLVGIGTFPLSPNVRIPTA